MVKSRYGMQGNGIRVRNFNEIDKEYLYESKVVQHFIPFEHEYRVLVDMFGVLSIKEKIGSAVIKHSTNSNFEEITNLELEEFCIDVCDKLGIDFTGIDIGEIFGKYYIIELNSAPSLSTENAKKLALHIKELLEELQ